MSQLNFLPWSSVPLSRSTAYEKMPAVLDNHKARWVTSRGEMNAFTSKHGPTVRAHLAKSGCALLRGFPLQSAQDFEDLLHGLNIPLSDSYEGGASPRHAVSAKTFTSTEASGNFLITPHNEMSYLPKRPETVAFYCDVEPEQYGETPIFNSKAMAQDLPRDLADKMQRLGILYRRSSRLKAGRWNVEKTLDQVFGTSDRLTIQTLLDKLQARSTWDEEGNLTFDIQMPAFVRHPAIGQECMNLVIFNKYAHGMDTALFKERWNPIRLLLTNAMLHYVQRRPRTFMKTLWGDGTELTRDETKTLLHTAWRHAVLFPWKKGDVLLLDNILWGHGRLNVKGPRRILAALGQPYDVFAMNQPVAAHS